ncbi:hypothetical protein [Desertivirga brevis]|uniref:hypothetical protein n=1 Tax=Desertivirga brevis TaxID=2810310 RepID=UPI001A97CED6|nr:hypothetical protein [Pedobacter sp. SYSU D00873]
MEDKDIPLYVIVELLIRVSKYAEGIGNYRNHFISEGVATVFTESGVIHLPVELLIRQFHHPQNVSVDELKLLVKDYVPL